jgi:hypothetical protein
VKTEKTEETAFPVAKKPGENLVSAFGVYPTNTPFAEISEAHVREFIRNFMDEYADRKDIVTSGGVSAESSVNFSHGKKLFSYLYGDWRDDGGAHGNITFSSETLDMNGKKYALSALFLPETPYLNTISQMAIVHFTNDRNVSFDPKDSTFGKGLAPSPENFATFFISGDKIIFQFQNYQIGPYSDGPQMFEIPVTSPEIKDIIRPELF